MKKIYSFMLMAAAMLLSANVSAATRTVGAGGTYSSLKDAFDAAVDGDVIQLVSDITTFGSAVEIGLDGALTLDMNNHEINCSDLTEMFKLYKGKLTVTGQGEIINGKNAHGAKAFVVYGTYEKKLPGEHSHLIIDENVFIKVNNVSASVGKGYGVQVQVLQHEQEGIFDLHHAEYPELTDYGFANGVLVEIKGDIEALCDKGYCVQITGNVEYVLKKLTQHETANENGMYKYYEFVRGGVTYQADSTWVAYVPKVKLYNTAHLFVKPDAKGVAAIYSSGYGIWDIQCEAEGSCALFIKSGQVTVTDAVLTSTSNNYDPIGDSGSSGVNTRGNAIAIESNANYAGAVQLTIQGDSKIEAKTGCAVEEVVTSASNTKVNTIDIQGGAFVGGNNSNASCIQISTTTQAAATSSNTTKITIGGGSFEDVSTDQKLATNNLISTILNNGGDPLAYTTEIATGNTTTTGVAIIITSGTAPAIQPASFGISDLYAKHSDSENPEDWNSIDLSNVYANTTFELELADDKGNLTLGDVVMNGEDLTIIVKDGVTFTVNKLIMNKKARIIVEAGGKLIVAGKQGIIAPIAGNILIEAVEGKMGQFLFNSTVSSNRHPHGTVELISKAYKNGNTQIWQRFGVPAYKGITRANIGRNIPTAFIYWDNATGWKDVATNDRLMPFAGYALSIESNNPGAKYTFVCDSLYGNVNAPLAYLPNWNYFANSYTAEIDIQSFVAHLLLSNVEAAMHINLSSTSNSWKDISYYDLVDGIAPVTKLAPMQCFTTKLHGDEAFKDTIKYETMVWNPAMGIVPNNAPARRNVASSDYTRAIVVIANGEGEQQVTLRQGAQFTNEVDNGADVTSFKASNFSIYANAEIGDMSQIATDNLMGQTLSIESAKATSFKMTFKGLKGETLAIRDNMTGSVINMVAGEEYFFSVAPGTTADRFEIVEAAKMPTDVEMIEAAPAKKGIYSLQGQYLGENFHVLPAGIYVVNGKKVVK